MTYVNEEMEKAPEAEVAAAIAHPKQRQTTDNEFISWSNKVYPQRRDQVFNIEFDGVIMSEGVLEMMPDGYGFLRIL